MLQDRPPVPESLFPSKLTTGGGRPDGQETKILRKILMQ